MSSEVKEMVCTMCPIGCPLELEFNGTEIIEVQGQQCNRGAKYAKQEHTDPRRTFSTTVSIEGGIYPRIPVKFVEPIPKARLIEAAEAIHKLHLQTPIAMGEVILKDLLGIEGVDVTTCRPMKRMASKSK